MTPTAGNATLHSSAGWVITAPTNRPPLEPPATPNFSAEVYPASMRYSAAEMKSSNTFCFCSFVPASCHFWPYSPPPRRLATAYTPPCSSRLIFDVLIDGVRLMLNPAYPYNNVGLLPSSMSSFLLVMIIGTLVPSLEV